ncbi:Uncharacterised protein [Legionella wadsworthii]|uniref:Uncharacterized protein n=1 Tax=Legionella wadsworthii TaxID=28088 RepID=A0A378LRP8_9GAMM|nr:hypothetical protein [Legionella wadsworthii]STY28518.1 Uncharacterised protein [Legionella wadsworthii]
MISKEEQLKIDEAQGFITDIRQNLSQWQHAKMPTPYREAQAQLFEEINKETGKLENDLKEATTSTQRDTAHEALKELHQNTTKAQLLSRAVITTSNLSKDEKIDPQAVLNTGIDTVRIGWNLATGLAFDKSKPVTEKMMGFAKACISGVMGMCQGTIQGYKEGKGFFDTVAKMVAGSFQQGMSGYNKSLATSLLNEKDRGRQIISDIKAEHDKVKAEKDDNPIKQARLQIIEAEEKYLDVLKTQLEKSSGKDLSNTVRSLELLQLSNAGTSLQSTCLSFLHKSVLGKDRDVDPKVLTQLGEDTLKVTQSVNRILDDSSHSMPSKLWTMTKAYVSAAKVGVESFLNGFQGKGLKEQAVNALVSGFSGFMDKFSKNLAKSAPKSTQLEADVLSLGSPNSSSLITEVGKKIEDNPLSAPKSSTEKSGPDIQLDTIKQNP